MSRCRPSPFFQPAVLRAGHHLPCRRVAHGHRQHEHVHLRDRPGLHTDGARGSQEDEGDHRLPERGQHPGARRQHLQHVRPDGGQTQAVPPAQEVRDESHQGPADDVHQSAPPLLHQGRGFRHWSWS